MPELSRKAAAGLLIAGLVGLAGQAPAVAQTTPPAAASRTAPAAMALRADQADLLRATLAAADRHGFEPGEFAPRGDSDAALVEATLRYAKAVKIGRLDPANFREDWGLRPQPFDARGGLARAVADNRLKEWLDSLPPPYPGYETLQMGLKAYRDIQDRGGWQALPEGADLKVGATGPAVEALRERLAVEDAWTPPLARTTAAPGQPGGGQPYFDEALAEAVRRAQKRMGLEPSGAVNASTRAALNIPVQKRIDQIVANMERWRWLPSSLPGDRVQVNVAAGVLTLFKDDQPSLSMRAIAGKPNGGETPLLSSEIHSIVLNPPWNVPAGIARREILPRGSAHLAANGFRILPGGMLQQRPGPNSALGLIKFDFQNPYAVYLHDTPSKGGFARYTRLGSHGCVRLEKPLALARALTEGDPAWTPAAIDETIAGGKTTRAALVNKVAVYLLYWTAYVTPDGQVNFRQDPYGWDALLIQRIANQGQIA
jgi:murein L,D-transpeptidase YcbB/YkuD